MDTLYTIEDKITQLTAKFEAGGIDEEMYTDSVDALVSGSLEEKLLAYVHVGENKRALATQRREKAKSLLDLAKSDEGTASKLDGIVMSRMEKYGIKNIDTADGHVGLKKNPPAVNIFDESKLPIDFLKHTEKWAPDKVKIGTSLKVGKEVPGAELTQSNRLDVK